MGYVRDVIYNLQFAAPEFNGLEVKVRSTSVEKFMEISDLSNGNPDPRSFLLLCEKFAPCLVEWNVERNTDAGIEPVPATYEGICSQDFDFILTIILQWIEVIANVATPLGEKLKGGTPLGLSSIPMEPLGESLAS